MKSLEELKALRDQMQDKMGIRNDDTVTAKIVVGMATCGIAAGAKDVLMAFVNEVSKCGLYNVAVSQNGVNSSCENGVAVDVIIGDSKVTYVNMTAEKAVRVVDEHIVKGNIVTEYTLGA